MPQLFDYVNEVLKVLDFTRIDGQLCCFNGYFYAPITSKKDVEALIYQYVPEILKQNKLKLIKDCAEVIFNLHPFPNNEPAEAYGLLGFNNAIYQYDLSTAIGTSCLYLYPPYRGNDIQLFSILSPNPDGRTSFNPLPLDYRCKITHILNVDLPIPPRLVRENPPSDLNGRFQMWLTAFEAMSTRTTDAFFYQIAGGDQVLIERIWEMLACILVPDPAVKAFFLLQGVPNSGKSVLGNFIASFFHKENVSNLDISRLGDKYSVSVLPGTYLNMSMDLPNQPISQKSVAMLKMLTGDDEITIEPKYRSLQSFRNRCRFLFGINFQLYLTDDDAAFTSRLVKIPFLHSVDKSHQDPYLLEKLKAERSAVAFKAVTEYYPKIKQKSFRFSGSDEERFAPNVHIPDQALKRQMRYVQEFIETKCSFNNSGIVLTDTLFSAYKKFCSEKLYTPISDMRLFSKIFKSVCGNNVRAYRGRIEAENKRGYKGVVLLYEPMIFDIPESSGEYKYSDDIPDYNEYDYDE